jgi:NADPH2:quinone reductase
VSAANTPAVTSTFATEVVLPGQVEISGLQIRTRELPAPAAGQVLMKMETTGISFAEQQMRRGKYYDQPAFPFVPGYDVVGTVTTTGPDVDPGLTGHRYAAVTKTGGWASHLLLDAADLIPVPSGLDSAEAETVVVNGITAWQMMFRVAKLRPGQTIVVLGASGGVGSTLVQLARCHGMTVIGTASTRHHDTVRALGATPVDYRDPELYARIRELAPDGVDAVFDHIGGPAIADSYKLLRRGGTLVSYGSVATQDEVGNSRLPVLKLVGRLALWNYLPTGRGAHFYNFWAGKRRHKAFQARLREDLTAVFGLLEKGDLTAQVGARFTLAEIVQAFTLAESHTVSGKIVLRP